MGGRDTVDRGGGVGGPPRRKRTMGPFPSEFKNHEVERKISEKKDRLGVADYQVWSLTQFYSVDFSKSRIDVKSAFSTNAQSRIASVVVDSVLGPPRLARHT